MNFLHFLSTCDLNRPTPEILLDLLWLNTGKHLPADLTTVGAPVMVPQSDAADDTTVQASLLFTGDAAVEFADLNSVTYCRIPLCWLTRDQVMHFDQPYPFTTLDVLDQINLRLGVQLDVQDVVDHTYTSAEDVFALEAHPDSPVWCNTPYPQKGPFYQRRFIAELPVLVMPAPAGAATCEPNDFLFSYQDPSYTPDPDFIF